MFDFFNYSHATAGLLMQNNDIQPYTLDKPRDFLLNFIVMSMNNKNPAFRSDWLFYTYVFLDMLKISAE